MKNTKKDVDYSAYTACFYCKGFVFTQGLYRASPWFTRPSIFNEFIYFFKSAKKTKYI